ncbi:MAG: FecR domain-containing protein [Myxococcota bacterium]
MSSVEPASRAEYVEPPDMERRLTAGWPLIQARLQTSSQRRRTRPMIASIAAAAAVVLAMTAYFLFTPPPSAPWVGTSLITATDTVAVHLNDGTEITAKPGSELLRLHESNRSIAVRMARGRATFDVKPDAERAFVVWAEDIEVRVIGTRFSVERQNHTVVIRVDRGSVDVRDEQEVYRLTAGDERRFTVAPAITEDSVVEDTPSEPPPKLGKKPRDSKSGRHEHRKNPSRTEIQPNSNAAQKRSSARSIFLRAQTLRAKGRIEAAVRAYQRMLNVFPNDSRAPLAAMEIGRLKMDALQDYEGAIHALERAAYHSVDSPLREDAMARIVRAYDRLSRRSDCERAQNAYLEAFPTGRYLSDVRRHCRWRR